MGGREIFIIYVCQGWWILLIILFNYLIFLDFEFILEKGVLGLEKLGELIKVLQRQ